MDPNQQPQPSQQPNNPAPLSSGQYDFINSPKPPKKKLFSFGGGGGMFGKLKIVAIGLGVFTVVILVLALVLSGGGGGDNDTLLSVGRKQNEVIRIAKIGIDKAGGNQTQSIALTSSMTVTTQQRDTISLLAKNGQEIKAKELALGADTKIDQELATAETNGRFDEVFLNVIKTQLEQYQTKLKSSFNLVAGKTAKQQLSDANDEVTLLLESIKR